MIRFVYPAMLIAAIAFAQEPAPAPRAHSANNRAIFIRKSTGSYLGIGVAEIDAERAKALKLNEVHGVEVKSVDPNSPAAKAGLKEGDVVLEYNSQRIEGTEQFVRMVHETPVDRQVRMIVARGGNSMTLTATIGQRSPAKITIHSGDGDDEDLDVEVPEMPGIPAVPPMPPMPPMPDLGHGMMSSHSGMLGIECESLGSQLAEYFGVKEGVLVRSVGKNSPAQKAGMRAGDVILKVAGEGVTSPFEITRQIHLTARTKRTFAVLVMRDKKEVTLMVTLDSSGGIRGAAPLPWAPNSDTSEYQEITAV